MYNKKIRCFFSDVCGPMSVESLGGAKYFVTFKDDASGFREVYFLKHKSNVYECFQKYERMVVNKFNQTKKVLRSDNGGEYLNKEMQNYILKRGIILETTASYTPEQNGMSERDNRTIVERTRTILHAKDLSLALWAKALNTSVYTLNRTESSKNPGITPYEIWIDKKLNLNRMRIFGSEDFVHMNNNLRKK